MSVTDGEPDPVTIEVVHVPIPSGVCAEVLAADLHDPHRFAAWTVLWRSQGHDLALNDEWRRLMDDHAAAVVSSVLTPEVLPARSAADDAGAIERLADALSSLMRTPCAMDDPRVAALWRRATAGDVVLLAAFGKACELRSAYLKEQAEDGNFRRWEKVTRVRLDLAAQGDEKPTVGNAARRLLPGKLRAAAEKSAVAAREARVNAEKVAVSRARKAAQFYARSASCGVCELHKGWTTIAGDGWIAAADAPALLEREGESDLPAGARAVVVPW